MYAIYAAEQVIGIFEKKYPIDKRPRKAIEAAKAYLKRPCAETKKAAYAAAYAAYAAAYAAYAYASAAAYELNTMLNNFRYKRNKIILMASVAMLFILLIAYFIK